LGTGFFVHHRTVLAVQRVEFVSDRVSYIDLRCRWCNIIVLNVGAPSEEKSGDSKDSFYEELGQVFYHFPKYHMKILRLSTLLWLGSCIQWMLDPSQSNVGNLNKVRNDASRHFRNKKKAYLKAKIEKLETNNKIKNIRDLYGGTSDFKKGYQPRTNTAKDDKGDLVADSHSILARWRNYFSNILNVHGVSNVRQTEIHKAEPLVPEPSASDVELAIEN